MTIVSTSPAVATAAGFDAETTAASGVLSALATAAGFAALPLKPTPVLSAVPDALRLEILTAAGAQLANDLVARRNLSFTVEHNGSGSVSFETDLEALPDGIDDPLLDPSNLVRVHFGDLAGWPSGVAEGFIASATPTKDDSGRWSLSVTCPGSWDVLDFGALWPPAGAVGDSREFSYTAGETGPSWVPEQWAKPIGRKVKTSWRWTGHRWPRGWPESVAQWIWSSSPEKASSDGARNFVGSFTLPFARNVRFYVAGDDTLRFYINGARVKVRGPDAWHKTAVITRRLPSGTHVVSASVSNLVWSGSDRSGFICAVASLNSDGDRTGWLLRTSPTSFKYRKVSGHFAQVPLPPDGWYPAAVLWQHVGEAAARGVDFHPSIVRAYSATNDTDGSAWTSKGPVEYEIGLSGAALGEKVRSLNIDVAMLPGLRLSAWKSRGFDLRDRVVISKANNVGWSSRTWSRVRTVALTHQESGWSVTNGDAALTAEFGRRELTLSGGGTDGDAQADALADSAMLTAASPEETVSIQTTSADLAAGVPQPFRDYNVADIVLMETVGGFTPVKVMSISGSEQDTKEVRFTIAGYPV